MIFNRCGLDIDAGDDFDIGESLQRLDVGFADSAAADDRHAQFSARCIPACLPSRMIPSIRFFQPFL